MFNPFSRQKKNKTETRPLEKLEKADKTEPGLEKEKKVSAAAWPLGVLVVPRLTEKSTRLSETVNQYVFEVTDGVNTLRVKDAVEKKYGVKVKKVNMLNSPGKKVRLGRQVGWRKGFKKAIVTLEKGGKIEFT